MIPLTIEPLHLNREQRRAREHCVTRIIKKLQKDVRQTALPVTFDNFTVTQYALFGFFEAFCQIIGLDKIIEDNLVLRRHHNIQYSATQLVRTLIDAVCLGKFRKSG